MDFEAGMFYIDTCNRVCHLSVHVCVRYISTIICISNMYKLLIHRADKNRLYIHVVVLLNARI